MDSHNISKKTACCFMLDLFIGSLIFFCAVHSQSYYILSSSFF